MASVLFLPVKSAMHTGTCHSARQCSHIHHKINNSALCAGKCVVAYGVAFINADC